MNTFPAVDYASTLNPGDWVLMPDTFLGKWMVVRDVIAPSVWSFHDQHAPNAVTQMHLRVHPVDDPTETHFWGPQFTDPVRLIRGNTSTDRINA